MKPLIVATGDPAGIGPEVSVLAAARLRSPVVLVGDGARLSAMLQRANVGHRAWGVGDALTGVGVLHAGAVSDAAVDARAPTAEGGEAQLTYLETGATLVHAGHGRALVTGPTSKAAVELSGVAFTGQTEHLAAHFALARDAVTMMFLGPKLRVALVTTHLSVRNAASAISALRVVRTLRHLQGALAKLGALGPIAVTGVNPHAGEGGLFGDEEDAIVKALALVEGDVHGPLPAEAAFRGAAAGRYAAVAAMLHDQATIASKLLDWGEAVNVTWGLPIVRTSVDHGTAFDIAGHGVAEASGMQAAMRLAEELTPGSS
ncbi:MAG: 4-hydroxythreonine-4-phosphate dehydrogenase PdxA [Myxococcota bacterium]